MAGHSAAPPEAIHILPLFQGAQAPLAPLPSVFAEYLLAAFCQETHPSRSTASLQFIVPGICTCLRICLLSRT
jgi:hypothetical protein